MRDADGWFACRVAYVETMRAVGIVAGRAAAGRLRREWAAFGVIEVDEQLTEAAADLTLAHELRTLDALHLAAALLLPHDGLVLATWDRRLHAAATSLALQALPATIS